MSDQFINVRLVKCNQLDLGLFQFDNDLTFCVFFMNADKTVYARYGVRSGHDADKDVAIEGLAATMEAVLAIHQEYPNNTSSLKNKQPQNVDHRVPEDFASLAAFKPTLDYEGRVASSCIHCHQVRDAARLEFRNAGKPLPLELLFPYPPPDLLGLEFDKKTIATISRVKKDSPAGHASLKQGDAIVTCAGQLIASEADFQWALHKTGDESSLSIDVMRGKELVSVELQLPKNWRNVTDLSWRPTTWDLRRMATGGMTLKSADEKLRQTIGVAPSNMALVADHVGQYGDHARAKKAGIQKGDIIVSFDGRKDLLTENALIEYAIQQKQRGDNVDIEYLRDNTTRTTSLKLH